MLTVGPLDALYRQEADLALADPGVGVPYQAVPGAQFALADVHLGVSALLALADSNYVRHPSHLLRRKKDPKTGVPLVSIQHRRPMHSISRAMGCLAS
jgi:hypothetical protein